MPQPSIAHTAEFQRIAALPRRVWPEADLVLLARELTSILRTPSGTMALRPVQALALHDAGTKGGLFGPIGVGEGKTLITMLLPVVLGATRPLLLLPAGLIEKTQRDRRRLSAHFQIPTTLRVFSYDMLGRVQSEKELDNYAPDAIICDEVHRLKNRRAAVTRRVARYMYNEPYTKFCGLSGTVMAKSIKDFAHIVRWCLKLSAPVPVGNEELEEWAEAMDEGVDPMARRRAGALLELAAPLEPGIPEQVAARRGFQRRLTETPGVVATVGEGEHVDCSIYVREIRHKVAQVTEDNFARLRQDMQLPTGWLGHAADGSHVEGQLMRAADVWRHAQELALGLHYAWDPPPPLDWREARKAWHAFVRETISRSRTYDSPLHVANAIDAGKIDDAGRLAAWRAIQPTFKPNVIPVWHDDSALKACRDWLKTPGLVWTEHAFFAEALAKFAGVPYYGAKGFTPDGKYIEDALPGSRAIASIDANREGKNLQTIWSRCLLVCPPGSAEWWEQLIARVHRPGQEADEVTIDVLLGCRENFDACLKALDGARAIQDTTGKIQKILLADVTLTGIDEMNRLLTPRWQR